MTIDSEPVLLSSILRNLVRNAIDYTPPGGLVTVTSHQRGSELRIEVCDTGTGIRASALPRVPNAFQRADQNQAGGLGLGLFIVKRAADLLGHRIDVHSVEGAGSRFTVVTRMLGYRASERSGPKAGADVADPRNSAEIFKMFTPPVPDTWIETTDETQRFMKALVGGDDRILGFSMIGVEAGEVMAVVQTAMLAGLRYPILRDAILTHPTMAKGLGPLFENISPQSESRPRASGP